MVPALPISFDPEFAGPAEWARLYRLIGLQVVPARTHIEEPLQWKRPLFAKWDPYKVEIIPDFTFSRWYGENGEYIRRHNMGMIAGSCSGGAFIVDLDMHKNPKAREWWQGVLTIHNFGGEIETPTQTTGGGGKQLLFRAPAGWTPPTCRTSIGVDIRGQGGFAMLPSSMHESGKEYAWDDGLEPWDLDIVTAPQWLCDEIDQLSDDHGGSRGNGGSQHLPPPDHETDAFGNKVDGREDYMTRLVWASVVSLWRECPIKPATAELDARMRDAFVVYERGVKSRIVEPGTPNHVLLDREGRGPALFAEKWRVAVKQWDGKIAEHGAQRPPERPTKPADPGVAFDPETGEIIGEAPAPKPEGIHATPFGWQDPTTIPPRAWIYGKHYIRKFLSTTVAPGGIGKTALEVVELLAIASGKALLGVAPDERANVWLWNGEDPVDEMRRRIMAAALFHRLKPQDITGRFFMDTGRATPIVIAEKTRDGAVINAPVIAQVIETIRANNIGVLSIDPFVSCHRVTENDNSEIERVAKAWAQIADITDCAIELVHHVRKTNGNEVSVEDGRGAVALLAAARAARALNRMTVEEAAKAGISDPGYYFRADNGKANLAPPSTGATWFKLNSFDLKNETPQSGLAPARPSDKIGVVEAWQWPDHTSDVTPSDMYAVRSKVGTGRYRADQQSSDWVGFAILEVIGEDANDPSAVAKAKALQRMWTQNRVLEEYDDKDDRRKTKRFIRAGPFEKEAAPP